jgi:hypothetical protein
MLRLLVETVEPRVGRVVMVETCLATPRLLVETVEPRVGSRNGRGGVAS